MLIAILCLLPPPRPRSQCIHTTTTGEAGLCRKLLKQAACPSKQTWWFVEGRSWWGTERERSPQNAPSLRCTSHPWPKSSGHDNGCTPGPTPLILLVDLKTSWSSSKPALKAVLEAYADILKAPAGHHQGDGGVLLAVSGSGSDQKGAPCGIDGRIRGLGDQLTFLEKANDQRILPAAAFDGPDSARLTLDQQTTLRALAKRVKGKVACFGCGRPPDTPEAWQTLIDCGAGLINTDQPTKAAKFVRSLLHSSEPLLQPGFTEDPECSPTTTTGES